MGPSPSADLRKRLVELAGTPEEDPRIRADLVTIAQLAADRIGAVSYASVTRHLADAHATVAASSELALAVDQAQYAEGVGPCLVAFAEGRVTDVPDISATMAWPGFREAAHGLGLRTSLSIPLFAGRGTPVASLNLYGHHPARMRPLSAAVRSVFGEPPTGPLGIEGDLDEGGMGQLAGLTGALAVRAVVLEAIGVVMTADASGPDQAYGALCLAAAATGVALPQVAARVIAGRRW